MRNWKISTLIFLTVTAGAFFIGRSSIKEKEKVAVERTTNIAASAPTRGTKIGNLAPEFQLVQMNGSGLSLADLSGQPAVLVFWASWCGFCRDEARHVNKLADAYASRGVRVFGINVRESQARTESGIKDFGIRYAVVRDIDGTAARSYNVEGIPAVFFLDSKGNVRYAGNGVPADYAERLDALLDTLPLSEDAISQTGELSTRYFEGTGRIVSIDDDKSGVTINHQTINGYMPAMTMHFKTETPEVIGEVAPGDTVRFTLKDTPELTRLIYIEKIVTRQGRRKKR